MCLVASCRGILVYGFCVYFGLWCVCVLSVGLFHGFCFYFLSILRIISTDIEKGFLICVLVSIFLFRAYARSVLCPIVFSVGLLPWPPLLCEC